METERTLITLSQLRARGWSDGLIARLLGPADETRPNPHYRTGHPMRLYALERVTLAEQDQQWQRYQPRRQRLAEAAKLRACRLREDTAAWASTVAITIPSMNKDRLIRRATAHWRQRALLRYDGADVQAEGSDPHWIERITVNYLRHMCSEYEALLEQSVGCVGRAEAYLIIRKRVLRAIAEMHGWLTAECERQGG